jgi:hypothetical protein
MQGKSQVSWQQAEGTHRYNWIILDTISCAKQHVCAVDFPVIPASDFQ